MKLLIYQILLAADTNTKFQNKQHQTPLDMAQSQSSISVELVNIIKTQDRNVINFLHWFAWCVFL